MEIGLREWMIVGAVIVIVLIVVDGWRRMRAQSNSLKIDIDDKLADLGDESYISELPLGTARVFKPKDTELTAGKTRALQVQRQQDRTAEVKDPIDVANRVEHLVCDQQSHFVELENTPQVHKAVPPTSMLPQRHEPSIESFDTARIDRQAHAAHSSDDFGFTALDAIGVQPSKDFEVTGPLIQPVAETDGSQNTRPEDGLHTKSEDGLHNRAQLPLEARPESFLNVGVDAPSHARPEHPLDARTEDSLNPRADSLLDARAEGPLFKSAAVSLHTEAEGSLFEESAEGSLFRESAEGSLFRESAEGSLFRESAEGSLSEESAEGSLFEESAEGSLFEESAEGSLFEEIAEGSLFRESAEGSLSEKSAEGSLFEEIAEGSLVARAQGSLQDEDCFVVPDILRKQPPNVDGLTDDLNLDDSNITNSVQRTAGFTAQDSALDNSPEESQSPSTEISQRERAAAILQSQQRFSSDQDHSYPLAKDKFEQLLAETQNDILSVGVPVQQSRKEVSADSRPVGDLPQHSNITAVDSPKMSEQSSLIERKLVDGDDFYDLPSVGEKIANDAEDLQSIPLHQAQPLATDTADVAQDPVGEHESEALRLSEIELLTARLKELSPDDFSKASTDRSSSHSNDLEADLAEHQTNLSAKGSTPVKQDYTTVIDDEVSLEDLAGEGAQLPVALTSTDTPAIVDPLVEYSAHSQASQDLMKKFEVDLGFTDQLVSNELDMPISEILKKNAVTEQSESKSTEDQKQGLPLNLDEDPLLDGLSLSEEVLCGDDFDDQNQPPSEHSGLRKADDLGFNALQQDYAENQHSTDDLDQTLDTDKSIENTLDQERLPTESEQLKTTSDSIINAKKPRKFNSLAADPDSVLIVTVVAKDTELDGSGLKQVVEACGMEFGDMDVFHRFEDGADQGAVQFSMANAIKPGTFDYAQIEQTSLPGVSFFMSMNEPLDPKNALECMLATAETVANHLNGSLLDDDKSVLRPQTKEHYRERVRIHEMDKLRRRAL